MMDANQGMNVASALKLADGWLTAATVAQLEAPEIRRRLAR